MLGVARERGFSPSQGIVEKWVGLGLLDQGTRRGRGKGRGATFLWPPNQLELFLALLDKRATVSRVRVLANLPVGVWTYWGEEFVPLRQVRRVMETWADFGRPRARHDWNAMARRVVDSIAGPTSTRPQRDVAVDLVADLARTRRGDVTDLVTALEPIVGGKDPSQFTDAPRVAATLLAQVTALGRLPEIPDQIFNWARAVLLGTQAQYGQEQPALSLDPRFGSLDHRPSFDESVTQACGNLSLILGLYLIGPLAPGAPLALDPELWISGRVRLSSSAVYEASPFVLPPGIEGGGRISVDVRIEIDPA
ncbi:MAG: hypothetical protein H0W81_06715 [Chloroflexi bacterium]|nr:hypothetical protein [Chloroflexota bacterium]